MVSAKKAQRIGLETFSTVIIKNFDFEKVIPLLNNLHGYGM